MLETLIGYFPYGPWPGIKHANQEGALTGNPNCKLLVCGEDAQPTELQARAICDSFYCYVSNLRIFPSATSNLLLILFNVFVTIDIAAFTSRSLM